MTGTEGIRRVRKTSDGTLNRMKTFNQFLARPNQFLSRSNQFLSRSSRFLSGQSDTEGESDNEGDSNLLSSQTLPHCCSAMQLSSCRGDARSRKSSTSEGGCSSRRSSGSGEMLGSLTKSMDRVKIRCRNLREVEDGKPATLDRPKKKTKARRNLGSFPLISAKSNTYNRLWNGGQDTEDEDAKDGEEGNNKKMMNYIKSRNNSLSSQERISPVFFLVVEDPDGVAVTDERDLPMERLSVPGGDSDPFDGKNAPAAERNRSGLDHKKAPLVEGKPPLKEHSRFKVNKLPNDGLYLSERSDCSSQPDLSSSKRKGLFAAGGGGGGKNGGITNGRVGAWATDFDKLLLDPAGLHTFAEFLKKEFSHENIYFWCACEKYARTLDGKDRMKIAETIMDRHLDAGAMEPVNIDSVARSATRDALASASAVNPPDCVLFIAAQKQIYNLMKFDSFPRFLKSDVYKECMLADLAGKPLPYNGLHGRDEQLIISPETKTGFLAPQEEGKSRRKSLLQSLVRGKRNRSKSKERLETTDQKISTAATGFFRSKKPSSLLSSPLSSRKAETNRLSLTTEELMKLGEGEVVEEDEKDACVLARVTLPDKATTVVNTRTGENIRQLINRLLDKRCLVYPCFDVLMAGKEKPLDLSEDCSVLGCSELRVEPRILFRLELPSGKSIGVKSKPDKIIEEVVSPILQQYGWTLDNVIITLNTGHDEDKEVNLAHNISGLDNKTVTVVQKSTS